MLFHHVVVNALHAFTAVFHASRSAASSTSPMVMFVYAARKVSYAVMCVAVDAPI